MAARFLPVLRAPVERVHDWNEFHTHVADSILHEQAGRCMDCGIPFCHTGKLLNGAASGCPLNNLIPDWNGLVFDGNWKAALELLHKTNNFPEFTGRVCPAPCEGSCVLQITDEPVTIKTIECAIVERGFAESWIAPQPPKRRTGKRVAVVGSGPAGLACAAELNKTGHSVTVFEKADRIGGLLMYGIPNMKLDKAIIQRRVDLLAAEGINFLTNVAVGHGYPTDQLLREFDAVVLCSGANRPRDLPIENRNLTGIHFAMEFLQANTKSLLDGNQSNGNFISARDKDVIVIGGGDTGTDCVATSLRHGCRSLVQFEILPQQPVSRTSDNPWPEWPRIHRVDYGHEEAVAMNGRDPRHHSVMSKRFIGDDSVRAVETVDVVLEKRNGSASSFREVQGTRRIWPTQLVLLAMGFVGPEKKGLISQLGLTLNEKGVVPVDDNKMTTIPGVFAAGDIERGQSLVVWAIADGRKAAACVHKYLTNH